MLSGGLGDDILVGGTGADALKGDDGSDTASYATATARVIARLANPGINTGDAAGDTYNSIENLTGSKFNDGLNGSNAANVINGGAGNDVIKGYGGNDTLTGETGQDVFIFSAALSAATNVDTITDFSVADDTISLDDFVFTALTPGLLAVSAFHIGAAAADASDRIVYNSATGALSYDEDGDGATAAILFATLQTGLALTNADFTVI
jgi:serralysin